MSRILGVGLLVVAMVAACSSGPSEEVQAFCDTFVQVEAAFGGEPDPATIGGLLDTLDASAPSQVAGAVGTMTTAARAVLESGDFALFESDEFGAANDSVDEYMVEECGYETVSVTARDYAFEGAPDALDAGVVAIEFGNDGSEFHEIAILKKNDGVTESFDELLQLPEDEAMAKVTMVGIEFAEPGGSGTTFADLSAGEYAFVCFIPVGATPENLPALESGEFAGGPPHFTQGMIAEFTVEG